MKKFLTFILVLAMVLSVSSVALAEGYVAKIDSTEYATFDDAITAANGMTGNVTVEIYGKVEYSDTTPNLTGAYDSISFEGKTPDAEIYISRNGSSGYISGGLGGQDCAVNFTDLICSKVAGNFAGDAGFMNVYFTVYRVGDVSYTNCTFPDGACCQGNKATYTKCTFNNNTSGEYSLWVYKDTKCEVINSTFSGVRGIKMYGEGATDTSASTLVVKNSTFSDTITEKAAIVLTKGKSIELSGNTYNNPEDKGTVQIDADYFSLIKDYAEVTIEGTKYKVGEGEATSGAVLKVELPVAKINGVEYTSLKAAMDAAAGMTGNVTIELLDDVEWETGGEHDSTPFVPDNSSVGTITIEGNNKTFTAKGAGVGPIGRNGKVVFKDLTVKDESVSYNEGAWEFGYLEFRGELEFINVNFKNPIMPGDSDKSDKDEFTFTGCSFVGMTDNFTMYGVWVDGGNATFTDCTFTGTRGLKVHEAYGSEVGKVIVDGCTFENLSEKPGIALGTLNRDTTVDVKDSHFMNCQPGDQSKYAYETDTDVKSFNFTLGEDNHICKGENNTTGWQTVKEPTATEDGLKVKLCLNNIIDIFNPSTTPGTTTSELCHYIVEEEIIPALGSGSGSTDSSKGSGISVKYNGGNSFSTSKSAVPTSVEIDGQPVPFNGDGKYFSVGCISSDAKWVTVRWNSTSVTTNFTPDGLVECTTVSIPKTGDMSIWAAIAEFLGF